MSSETTPTIDRVRKRMDEYAETYGVRGDFAVSVLRSEFEAALVEIVATKLNVEEMAQAMRDHDVTEGATLSWDEYVIYARRAREAILGSD